MSLYLKYRPQDFSDITWQTFITETLKKAVAEWKTVWAYLLCWTRWTWKTTTARILAKSINCLNNKNWDPCLECEICKDFLDEKLIDIIEIDAASNTWVDNIRDIIEKSKFSPTKCKYKVYIVDEVHMLSKWAFNALLKILEEPPKHVKFILATTEVHKIPETILSRCQRYDFKRISESNILKRLEYISEKEWVKSEKKALEYIASISDWALRNAVSLFEQYIISSEIKYENISENLWIVWKEQLENILEKLVNKDKSVISDFEEIYSGWKNLKLFIKDFLLFSKDKLIEVVWTNKASGIIKIIETLNDSYIKSKNSFDEKTSFLIAFVKLVSPEIKEEIVYVKKEIQEKLEKNPENKPEINLENTKKEEEISMGMVEDLFWDLDFWNAQEEEKQEIKKESIKVGVNSQNFDMDRLTSSIKEVWWKAFVTQSLKNSNYRFEGWVLLISPKSEAMYRKLNTIETKDMIKSHLEKLGYDFDFELRF